MTDCNHDYELVSTQFVDDPIPIEYDFYKCKKCAKEYEIVDYA